MVHFATIIASRVAFDWVTNSAKRGLDGVAPSNLLDRNLNHSTRMGTTANKNVPISPSNDGQQLGFIKFYLHRNTVENGLAVHFNLNGFREPYVPLRINRNNSKRFMVART